MEDLIVVFALDAAGGDLGGDLQGTPGRLGDLDRLDDALLGSDPPDEAQRVRARLAERRLRESKPVVDDARPWDVRMGRRLVLG